jgi:hypothetical protein
MVNSVERRHAVRFLIETFEMSQRRAAAGELLAPQARGVVAERAHQHAQLGERDRRAVLEARQQILARVLARDLFRKAG